MSPRNRGHKRAAVAGKQAVRAEQSRYTLERFPGGPSLARNLGRGHIAWLTFRGETDCETLGVQVLGKTGARYYGALINWPNVLRDVRCGEVIAFGPEHLVGVSLRKERLLTSRQAEIPAVLERLAWALGLQPIEAYRRCAVVALELLLGRSNGTAQRRTPGDALVLRALSKIANAGRPRRAIEPNG